MFAQQVPSQLSHFVKPSCDQFYVWFMDFTDHSFHLKYYFLVILSKFSYKVELTVNISQYCFGDE